jgi:hypothetical protein
MNSIIKLRGLLHPLAIAGVVAATAPSAGAAWSITYCDGYNSNNYTAVSGAGCETPRNIDCWEDPNHTPPVWELGKTYARTQVRVCSGTRQIRAYAFGNLKAKSTELGGNGYKAIAWAMDSFGSTIGSVVDSNADNQYSGWVTVNAAVTVASYGYVTHT